MSETDKALDDLHQAVRSIIVASRQQVAMIATTQIAVLSVIEQLADSDLIDAIFASDRMREMVGDFPSMEDLKLEDEVALFADRLVKLASIQSPGHPTPPKVTGPKLVKQ